MGLVKCTQPFWYVICKLYHLHCFKKAKIEELRALDLIALSFGYVQNNIPRSYA